MSEGGTGGYTPVNTCPGIDPTNPPLYTIGIGPSISLLRHKGYTAETLWDVLKDIPVDDDGITEVQFLHFPPGTDREDIWHWFEDTFDISINNLMFKKNTGPKSIRSTYLEHSIICSDEGYCYCALCGKDDIADGYVHTWGKCKGVSLYIGMVVQSTLGHLYCIDGAGEEYVYLRVLGHDLITETLTVELVNLLNSGAWIVKHNLMENSMFPDPEGSWRTDPCTKIISNNGEVLCFTSGHNLYRTP